MASLSPPRARFDILLPLLAILTAMAAFQGGAALAKGLFPSVGPQGAAALRVSLSALMLLAITRPWRAWPRDAPLLPVLGLGASIAAAITFFYMALERLPLGVAIPLQFLGPLSIAVLGSRRPSDFLWAGLAAAGVWQLVGGLGGDMAYDPVGVLLALGAAMGWAGYILCGRRASAALGQSTAAPAIAVAALIVAPVGLAHAGGALFDPKLLPLALVVALVSSAIPFTLELYALPRLPARTFATFTSLEPAFAVLFGFALLHERLSAGQIAGVALVIAAAAGAAWTSGGRRAAVTEAPPN